MKSISKFAMHHYSWKCFPLRGTKQLKYISKYMFLLIYFKYVLTAPISIVLHCNAATETFKPPDVCAGPVRTNPRTPQ
jgi:hypothetical protein